MIEKSYLKIRFHVIYRTLDVNAALSKSNKNNICSIKGTVMQII